MQTGPMGEQGRTRQCFQLLEVKLVAVDIDALNPGTPPQNVAEGEVVEATRDYGARTSVVFRRGIDRAIEENLANRVPKLLVQAQSAIQALARPFVHPKFPEEEALTEGSPGRIDESALQQRRIRFVILGSQGRKERTWATISTGR